MAFDIDGTSFADVAEFINSGQRCATPEPNLLQIRRIDGGLRRFRAANTAFRRRQGTITINVQFTHIVDGTEGRISEQRRRDQIQVLNDDYGPHQIQFSYDPATVNEIDNSAWFRMDYDSPAERQAKSSLNVTPERTLNFYTAGFPTTSGLLGWATFPWELAVSREMDGVVMRHSTLPGGTATPYNLGRTATHEVGHWLGLFHTFQGGCNPVGDQVRDTVAHGFPNFGEPDPNQNNGACDANENAPVKNYMNYTDDVHMDRFTTEQGGRMRELIALFRAHLLQGNADEIGRFERVSIEP